MVNWQSLSIERLTYSNPLLENPPFVNINELPWITLLRKVLFSQARLSVIFCHDPTIQDDIVPDCTSHGNVVSQAVHVGQGDKARMLRLQDARTLGHQGGCRDVEGAMRSPVHNHMHVLFIDSHSCQHAWTSRPWSSR